MLTLWQTALLRLSRLRLADEIDEALRYYDLSLFEVVPEINAELRRALGKRWPDADLLAAPMLRPGSWIGGDRDGNPFVTADAVRRATTSSRPAWYAGRVQALGPELSGELLTAPPCSGVHERGAPGLLREPAAQEAPLRRLGARRDHVERQVRAIEPGSDLDGIAQAQRTSDVRRDAARCRRGEHHRAARRDLVARIREAQVVGTEVVTPVGQAVGLVDREQVDGAARHRLTEAGVCKPLGGDVRSRHDPSATAARVAEASSGPSDESSRNADSCPRARNASTWSRINAWSGETTMVSSSVARPGIA